MGSDVFRYDGKRVLVVGGATGMGAATAQLVADLGAEVIVLDVADVTYPVAASAKVDLRDQASVDTAVDGIDGRIDVVMACAGVADGTEGLMRINFIAQRHLIDRLIERGSLGRGGSVVFISSAAGIGWQPELPTLLDFLSNRTWDEAVAWPDSMPGYEHYMFSKQVINAYVAAEAMGMLTQGIRLNAILPGPTDTPLSRANDLWLEFGVDYRAATGRPTLVPEQMAGAMAFLGSDAASGVSGVTLVVDDAQVASSISGAFPDELVNALLGQS
ncbi:MAG: SDR family oxidoreductase [Acidimicrobiales bacterium]|nr:SDR family oxidoreductase [Acidimicrobiales bacterium]